MRTYTMGPSLSLFLSLSTLTSFFTMTACTSSSVGTQASLSGGSLKTAGLADQKLAVEWADGSRIHASGPGASDYINIEGGQAGSSFDAHSTYPEATSIIELPDGTRLVANDTGDVRIDEVELRDANGRTQTIRGFQRTLSAQVHAEADRLAFARDMANAMSADQQAAFVDYMDTSNKWAQTFGDVAAAARAVFAPIALPE